MNGFLICFHLKPCLFTVQIRPAGTLFVTRRTESGKNHRSLFSSAKLLCPKNSSPPQPSLNLSEPYYTAEQIQKRVPYRPAARSAEHASPPACSAKEKNSQRLRKIHLKAKRYVAFYLLLRTDFSNSKHESEIQYMNSRPA